MIESYYLNEEGSVVQRHSDGAEAELSTEEVVQCLNEHVSLKMPTLGVTTAQGVYFVTWQTALTGGKNSMGSFTVEADKPSSASDASNLIDEFLRHATGIAKEAGALGGKVIITGVHYLGNCC